MTRPEALTLLLALPDEPCLRRGSYVTQPRSPFIDAEILKRDLATAYITHRRQDHVDESSVVRVRRLKIVRRA